MIYIALNEGKFLFIDFLNLLIHEGGHGIFSFLGKFLYTLGGTIAQIFIPLMFVVYYGVVKRHMFMQVFMVWLGQNLINVSVYAADARSHKLPLLGGNKVYHDWTYLLNETGLILYDKVVGDVFYWLGITVFVAAFVAPLFFREYKKVIINLEI